MNTKRTHSHLYRWYDDSEKYEFVEAINYEAWKKENRELKQVRTSGDKHDYFDFILPDGEVRIYRVPYIPDSISDYEPECPFCTGHSQEPAN